MIFGFRQQFDYAIPRKVVKGALSDGVFVGSRSFVPGALDFGVIKLHVAAKFQLKQVVKLHSEIRFRNFAQ